MKNAVLWYIKSKYAPYRKPLHLLYRAQPVNVRFEVFTAVTMKNAVFWDIKTQFIPHRRHITLILCKFLGFHSGDYEECPDNGGDIFLRNVGS
jgi:hypothetical protein